MEGTPYTQHCQTAFLCLPSPQASTRSPIPHPHQSMYPPRGNSLFHVLSLSFSFSISSPISPPSPVSPTQSSRIRKVSHLRLDRQSQNMTCQLSRVSTAQTSPNHPHFPCSAWSRALHNQQIAWAIALPIARQMSSTVPLSLTLPCCYL